MAITVHPCAWLRLGAGMAGDDQKQDKQNERLNMIGTMMKVRCKKCGGDDAPIIGGEHIKQEDCDQWRNRAVKTMERLEEMLQDKINGLAPSDSVCDSVAIPA